MDLGLQGKIAVVTGGTKGIGRATAEWLAHEGAQVAICARNEKDLQQTADEIELATGRRPFTMICDVTENEQVQRFFSVVLDLLGTVHILVNNAGRAQLGRFEELTWQQWQDDLNVKLYAHIRCIKAVLPAMKSQRWGRIININSILGKQPSAEAISTSTWRAACIAFTKALANELAPYNITVNSINLGIIISNQLERRRQKVEPNLTLEEFADKVSKESGIPMGRLGKPEEVAALVCFLASEHAGYITGASINIDGGASKFV
ncbi:MAG: SDR family oxidoreductase [Armatimonadetes bacterium]|nr:SDR family oxidoreductase [Armatimonadota bacterium]